MNFQVFQWAKWVLAAQEQVLAIVNQAGMHGNGKGSMKI